MSGKVNHQHSHKVVVWTDLRNGGKLNLSSSSNTLRLVWCQRTDEWWCASHRGRSFL